MAILTVLSGSPVRAQSAAAAAAPAAAATGPAPAAAPALDTAGSDGKKKPDPSVSPAKKEAKPAPANNLDTVVVTESDLTSVDVAAHDLDKTSGATSLVAGSDYQKGRSSNLGDALRLQPGVLAQSNNGGEQTRISIRGSGIQRAPGSVPQGLQYLISGQSLKDSSGYPITAALEPLAVNYIEIYRGQAAFADYGPLAIGGAINFVTKTGYDASPFQVRSEVGSDGYFKEQASSGLVVGNFDYYASVSHDNYDGFRDNSRGSATRAIFNLGDQITPDLSTRLNIEYTQQFQQSPGTLTLHQVQTTPQATATPTYVPSRDDPESVSITSNTTLRVDDDSSLSWGGIFEKAPSNSPGTPGSETGFDQYAFNGSVHYKRSDTVFGDHVANTKVSFLSNNSLDSNEKFMNAQRVTVSVGQFEGNDQALVLSTDLELVPNLWLSPGVSGVFQHRAAEADSLAPGRFRIDRDYEDFVPNLGLRYEFTPQSQVYFNAGRTVEAPHGTGYLRTGTLGPTGILDLEKQISDTVEVGTRGSEGIFQWDVALYNSWIQHELLTTYVTQTPPVTATQNANATIHQGIEAGLGTLLWHEDDPARDTAGKGDPKSLWEAAPERAPHRLVLQQSYTYNHFYFDNDPVFQSKSIAGVPVHLYQAELRYEHWSGLHLGPTVESSFTHYAADYANTIFAPSYVIFGAKIGYAPPKQHWEVFFEADNLSNEKYVSIVSPITNANGTDSAVYTPGAGRSVSGGFSYSF